MPRVKSLKGSKILITAGPTRESIDPVRFISNRSSGKMGYALAKAAKDRGAQVTLISGPTALKAPSGIKVINVETTEQMYKAVMKNFKSAEIVIMAAAPSDYAPIKKSKLKIKKIKPKLKIELKRTPDILAALGRKKGKKILVGFSVETEKLVERSKEKLKKKNLDLVVANDPSAFEVDRSLAKLIYKDRLQTLPKMSKAEMAERILESINLCTRKLS